MIVLQIHYGVDILILAGSAFQRTECTKKEELMKFGVRRGGGGQEEAYCFLPEGFDNYWSIEDGSTSNTLLGL